MIINISYDLKKPGQDYKDLIEEIKKLGSSWCHPVKSTWLIDTALTPQQVYERISKHLDQNDLVLAMELKPGCARWGLLPKEAWAWIDARL